MNSFLINALGLIVVRRKRVWENVEAIFIHIPKAAGSSIRLQMVEDFGQSLVIIDSAKSVFKALDLQDPAIRAVVMSHMSPQVLVKLGLISEDTVNQVAFATIRNPRDRFISAWNYGMDRRYFPRRLSKRQILTKLRNLESDTFHSSEAEGYHFLRPQTDFTAGFDIPLRRLTRVDQISADTRLYSRQSRPIPHTNVRADKAVNGNLPSDISEEVRRTYAKDFNLWERLLLKSNRPAGPRQQLSTRRDAKPSQSPDLRL